MTEESGAVEAPVEHKLGLVERLRQRGDFFATVGSPVYAREVIEASDEIERLRVQVLQADERGDEAMRRAHAAEAEIERLRGVLLWISENGPDDAYELRHAARCALEA